MGEGKDILFFIAQGPAHHRDITAGLIANDYIFVQGMSLRGIFDINDEDTWNQGPGRSRCAGLRGGGQRSSDSRCS